MSTNQHVAAQPVLRTIPLSRIIVPDGHNPRERFDEDAHAALTADVAKRGILQPIRVALTPTGDYALIAGERRYRAAIAAALMEIPASVRMLDPDQDADEQVAELLEEAAIENMIREDLDPIEEARACQRLRELGRTVRGIAQTLRPGVSRRAGEAWVKSRLQLLELPEQMHPHLADGTIPLGAVDALRAVAAIDPACAALVADQVGQDNQYGQQITWGDVAEDPVGAVLDLDPEQLPAAVYVARHVYPASRFTLTDKATKALPALAKLHDVDAEAIGIRFEHPEFEQAAALGATHNDRWNRPALIVGQDVADQLERAVSHRLQRLVCARSGIRGGECAGRVRVGSVENVRSVRGDRASAVASLHWLRDGRCRCQRSMTRWWRGRASIATVMRRRCWRACLGPGCGRCASSRRSSTRCLRGGAVSS